jgi:hypothetical protein
LSLDRIVAELQAEFASLPTKSRKPIEKRFRQLQAALRKLSSGVSAGTKQNPNWVVGMNGAEKTHRRVGPTWDAP